MANLEGTLWCPACDRAQAPSRMVRQLHSKQEGMVLRCAGMGHTYSYDRLMSLHPRMDKPDQPERQPPNTIVHQVWVYPEVLAALRNKFPQNLATTLCSCLTALADADTVLIEGEWAREMAALGIKRGREVLALAKEVKELRDKVKELQMKEDMLANFFRALGVNLPQAAVMAPAGVATVPDPASSVAHALPVDAAGNPLQPPRAQFSSLVENASGLLVPADGSEQQAAPFSFGSGAPVADERP